MPPDPLADLSLGFRSAYLDHADLTRQLEAWRARFPEVVGLDRLVESEEGRVVWLLTIGRRREPPGPAVWVDGNMHATELAGSSAALAIAEEVIRLHVAPETRAHRLPGHLVEALREVTFHIAPRLSPDGAEAVLRTGAFVRSNPRDRRTGRREPYWWTADVDGDGRALLMRKVDPAGEFVIADDVPHLMLPRQLVDPGPYYKIYPEGTIENFDGFTVPSPHFLSDNQVDLNRNFPYSWAPEVDQVGAGDYPLSEPESRAVVEFAARHPNLFAWLNFHTFGGVFIRPCGDRPDKKMNPKDLALYRQLEAFCEKLTGYPMVSGYEEFTYEPDKPLRGDLSDFAYVQRGAVGYVCELWDLFRRAGLEVHRPFVWNYQRRTREDALLLARWDAEHNRGRVFQPWRPWEHPQLGPVEVGGFDPRFGFWNPPQEALAEVVERHCEAFLRVAALAPRLALAVDTAPLAPGLHRISAVLDNLGYLPTYVLDSARAHPWNEPLRVELSVGGGAALVAGDRVQVAGHLEGWGDHDLPAMPFYARSRGNGTRRRVVWTVEGRGTALVRATGPRVGAVEQEVVLS